MDELEMISSGRIVTDLLGTLLFKTSLLSVDYPRAFICETVSDKHYYAFLENDDSYEEYGWNVTEVELADINKVNLGEENLQSLFIDKPCYLVTGGINSETCVVEQVDSFTGDNSIEGNLYVPHFCDMDEIFDYHSLHSRSIKDNKVSFTSEYDLRKLAENRGNFPYFCFRKRGESHGHTDQEHRHSKERVQ